MNVDEALETLKALAQTEPDGGWRYENAADVFRQVDADPRERRRIHHLCELFAIEDRLHEQAIRLGRPDAYETDDEEWTEAVTRNDSSPTGVELELHRAHPARMYDYYLDGKDNYPADQEAAQKALAVFPNLRTTARENRAFLRRATAYLTRAGYRQFLDVGTGVPTRPNLHEVAQSIAAQTRVVYADNDPLVLAQARALLTSDPAGRTAYLAADLRDPDSILAAPELAETLDLTRPVVLSLVAVLHFIPDTFDPYGIVATLLAGLPAGSALMLSHITTDHDPAPMADLVATYQAAGIPVQARSREQIGRFFTGLDLVEPGVVSCQRWHADPTTDDGPTDAQVSCLAAVGRMPATAG